MHPAQTISISSSSLSNHLTPTEHLSSDQLLQAKKALRQRIRKQRKQLSTFHQVKAANQLLKHLNNQYWYRSSRHIAVYLANDGELSCSAVIDALHATGKQVYLPVLHPINHRQLMFVRYDQHTPMRYNRFGIKEPQLKRSRLLPPEALDLILMPLVGFDLQGNRLGMGGGFYDTTLDKVINQGWRPSPLCAGLAHPCQQVDALPKEPWDVPLDAVVTPTYVLRLSV